MEEILKGLRTNIDFYGEVAELTLNILSLVSIAAGVVLSIARIARDKKSRRRNKMFHLSFRLMFGGWLVVALEFQLAADIVSTIVSPSYERLIQLAVVALIRTFLNYFLVKELDEGARLEREDIQEGKMQPV